MGTGVCPGVGLGGTGPGPTGAGVAPGGTGVPPGSNEAGGESLGPSDGSRLAGSVGLGPRLGVFGEADVTAPTPGPLAPRDECSPEGNDRCGWRMPKAIATIPPTMSRCSRRGRMEREGRRAADVPSGAGSFAKFMSL